MKDYHGKPKDSAGRMVSIWINPSDTNHILAGAAAGGLWETENSGVTWRNITDNVDYGLVPGTMGITNIAVHPTNPNLVYIATGTNRSFTISMGYEEYSMGLVYSPDYVKGGSPSWYVDGTYRSITSSPDYPMGFAKDCVQKLAYSSSGQLFAMTRKKIYRKASTSAAWTDITPADFTSVAGTYDLLDFEFTNDPASGSKVVFVTNAGSNTQYLYYYNLGTALWSPRRTLFFAAPTTVVDQVRGMGLSAKDSVCLVVKDTTKNKFQLFKTALHTGALLLRNGSLHNEAADVYTSKKVDAVMYVTNFCTLAGALLHFPVER
jgi:hypothetical protein